MSECNHDCKNCQSKCNESLLATPNELSHIKHVIAVVSGKGGVGKSLVTSMLASALQKEGFSTAVLDADVTGPSIPHNFGLKQKALSTSEGILPVYTVGGIAVMSLNLITENETDPVIWRGPIIAGAVKQFYTDVVWNDVDFMFVDMPPGTGDVPITIFQSLPVDGIVLVTSPQQLVSMIVEKATQMANKMNVPILAVVENMSYFECPDCKKRHYLFGDSHLDELAQKYGIETSCRMPIDQGVATKVDQGRAETVDTSVLGDVIAKIISLND